MSSTSPDALARIALFEGLPRPEISRLLGHLHERPVPAGTNLLVAEQPGEAVYVILSGSVKVYASRPDGTEVVLAVLGPGEVFGEMSVADSLGRSASVVTLEETDLLWMDRRTFRASVESSAILARNLAEVLSGRVRLANSRLISLASLDVAGRVASELLSLASEYGQATPEGVRIPMRLTQSDRETVSLLPEASLPPALLDPERESGLEFFGGVFSFRDRTALRQLLGARSRRAFMIWDSTATRPAGTGAHDDGGEQNKGRYAHGRPLSLLACSRRG